MTKQRQLLEVNKEFKKGTNIILWEMVFWNEDFPDVIERRYVQEEI